MPTLTEADTIYVGDLAADAVYLGDTLVWSSGPPPWSPADLSGLTAWLDAASVGSITTTWPDKSGLGHDGAVVGTPPPVVEGVSPTGKPVMRFRAGQGRIRGVIPDLTTDFTISYVARMVGPTVGRAFGTTLPPKNYWLGFHGTGMDGWMYGNGSMFQGVVPYGALPSPWKVYTALARVDVSSQFAGFYGDGSMIHSYAGAPVDFGPGATYNLSGWEPTGAAETADFEFGEMLIYDRGLPDAERRQVENYLLNKWVAPTEWAPDLLPGLSAWYDADDPSTFTLTSESRVTEWRDKSPRALHLPGVAGSEPSRTGSRAGRATVVFPGDRCLHRPGNTGINVGEMTLFFVFAESSHQIGNSGLFSLYPPGGDDWASPRGVAVEMGPGNTIYQTARAITGGATALIYGTPPSPWSLYRTDCGPTGIVDVYRNGVGGQGANNPNTFGVADGGIVVGARYFSGAIQGAYRLAGDVGEIIVYDRVLDAAEVTQVEDYLRAKWDIYIQDWFATKEEHQWDT